ncbi:MAG: HAD family hydrolase [Butyrivibrio sp.]|nr:HAD family hydrolase [Butyrivibrio sp.]
MRESTAGQQQARAAEKLISNTDRRPLLIASDLDHTLLHHANEITQRNFQAIERLRAAGTLFCVATGRCSAIVPRRNLPGIDVLISCNGSVITDASGQILHRSPMDPAAILRLMPTVRRLHPFMELFVEDNIVIERDTMDHLDTYRMPVFHRAHIEAGRHVVIERWETWLTEAAAAGDQAPAIGKVNYPGALMGELLELAEEARAMGCFEVSTDGGSLEMTNPGVNKGQALLILCEKLGIDPARTLAFGDGANDAGLLRAAGTGVAMADGVQAALDAADVIGGRYQEDAVAAYIDSI